MTDKPRNFDEEFDLGAKPSHSFVLGGKTFHTKPALHPKAFLSAEKGLAFAVTLIRAALVPEDRPAFEELLDDPDVLISARQVDSVGSWLVEVYSERPTVPPTRSGGGRSGTKRTSKVDAPSPAKTGTG